jgi:hypothetical protein
MEEIMEEYRLLTNDKETINTVRCNSFIEAVEYFAEKKKLHITSLLEIFDVSEVTIITTGGSSRK